MLVMEVVNKNTGYEQQAADAGGDSGGDGEEETSGGQVQNSENGFDSMCDKDGRKSMNQRQELACHSHRFLPQSINLGSVKQTNMSAGDRKKGVAM